MSGSDKKQAYFWFQTSERGYAIDAIKLGLRFIEKHHLSQRDKEKFLDNFIIFALSSDDIS